MIVRRGVVAGMLALVAALTAPVPARADQSYVVDGRDVFRIGAGGDGASRVSYHGTQTLTVRKNGPGTTYVARVTYDKIGDGTTQRAHASYVSTLAPSGEQRDGAADDPDYLTVLNQPFAVQLDAATMRDLAHVKRPVPFDFPSPMTGAPLRGTLQRLPDGTINGIRVMGIGFEASGPLHGALPDRPSLALSGAITMRGRAYYAYADALLMGLDATLSIDGNLDDATRKAPVSIVYQRTIRPAAGPQTAGKSGTKKPPG